MVASQRVLSWITVACLVLLAANFVVFETAYATSDTPRGVLTTADSQKATQGATTTGKGIAMYRLYNPRNGEHLYTADANEKNVLKSQRRWNYEGIAWYAPQTSKTPVFRLYNKAAAAHHYTIDKNERDTLVQKHGWTYEGVGWYSTDDTLGSVPVYRVYNPRYPLAANHHFTTDANEQKTLVSKHGWKNENIAWYATAKGTSIKDGWQKVGSSWRWYNEGVLAKNTWISTNKAPNTTTNYGTQRYHVNASGNLQTGVFSVDGNAYYGIPSRGYIAKGKTLYNGKVYLADNSGKLEKAGWLVTKKYDGTLQRYYIDAKTRAAKTGLFKVGTVRYYGWPELGYVLRNSIKYVGTNWWKADNNGKLTVYKTSRLTHINRYVNWAVGIANDNKHGYSQFNRWGPDYDCSSLVISALKAAGFNVGTATYTGNMRAQLTKYGFKWYTNLSKIDRGDILLNEVHHTAIYLGNGQQVAATISEKGTIYGKAGDQTGREITVQNYFNYPWNGFLRYEGK